MPPQAASVAVRNAEAQRRHQQLIASKEAAMRERSMRQSKMLEKVGLDYILTRVVAFKGIIIVQLNELWGDLKQAGGVRDPLLTVSNLCAPEARTFISKLS